MESTIYNRTEILLGKENVDILKQKHVMICGVGGVGSYVLEALARVGIGRFTVIDKDVVDITNINRQIIATYDTIGKDKVEVAKKRVQNINKDIDVISIKKDITSSNVTEFFNGEKVDYVVDCVDNAEAKIALISECNKLKTPCISCMGMGNKLNPLDIKVDDIYKTSVCPLARIIRKKLKDSGVKKQKVVYSIEEPKKKDSTEKLIYGNNIGSISFVPSVAGLVIASEVIKDILKI